MFERSKTMERKFSGYSHIRYSIEVGDNVLVEVVNSNQEVSTFSGSHELFL